MKSSVRLKGLFTVQCVYGKKSKTHPVPIQQQQQIKKNKKLEQEIILLLLFS